MDICLFAEIAITRTRHTPEMLKRNTACICKGGVGVKKCLIDKCRLVGFLGICPLFENTSLADIEQAEINNVRGDMSGNERIES